MLDVDAMVIFRRRRVLSPKLVVRRVHHPARQLLESVHCKGYTAAGTLGVRRGSQVEAVGQRFLSMAGDRAHVRRLWHTVVLWIGDKMRPSTAGRNVYRNLDSDMNSRWWWSRLAKV